MSIRVIEEFNRTTDDFHREYVLKISPEEILVTLDDLVLNEDDYPDEIYDKYDLTEGQINKLRPFLVDPLEEDFSTYIYCLACFADPDPNAPPPREVLGYEQVMTLYEFNRETRLRHELYRLSISSTDVPSLLWDLVLEEGDSFEDNDYATYELTEAQVARLASFIKEDKELVIDVKKYEYYLNCVTLPIYES